MLTSSRRQFLGNAAGLAATGLAASRLGAQEWAKQMVDKSPRKHEWVTVKNGARNVDTFVVHPQAQKAPAMVVIHEIFGMTDWVQSVADEFAAAGFLAVAPDLLTGAGPNGAPLRNSSMQEAGQLIQKLPPDQITADLNAVADYVKGLPGCNGKVCVVGFSWGGGESFRFATNRRDLSAAFVFYGSGPSADAIARIQAPVYGFYAGTDQRINASLPQTEQQMKAAGKKYEVVTYDGAGHGFMRAGADPAGAEANKKARDAAWVKIKALEPDYK